MIRFFLDDFLFEQSNQVDALKASDSQKSNDFQSGFKRLLKRLLFKNLIPLCIRQS